VAIVLQGESDAEDAFAAHSTHRYLIVEERVIAPWQRKRTHRTYHGLHDAPR